MRYLKAVTPKRELVWINPAKIFYITYYKHQYRIYFEDGMSCDAVEISLVTEEEFLHSLTEK